MCQASFLGEAAPGFQGKWSIVGNLGFWKQTVLEMQPHRALTVEASGMGNAPCPQNHLVAAV